MQYAVNAILLTLESSLNNCKISSKGAITLFDFLRNKPLIKRLNLGNNQLDDEIMKDLGELLRLLPNLYELSLEENKITDKGIEYISQYLVGNQSIRILDLSGNQQISDFSTTFFRTMIDKSCICDFYLLDTGMSLDDAFRLELDGRINNGLCENIYFPSRFVVYPYVSFSRSLSDLLYVSILIEELQMKE